MNDETSFIFVRRLKKIGIELELIGKTILGYISVL